MDVFKDLNGVGLYGPVTDDLIEDRLPPPPEHSVCWNLFGPCCGKEVSHSFYGRVTWVQITENHCNR